MDTVKASGTKFENLDVYLHGMTVLSTIHKLNGTYPESDTYREIKETYVLPGGETGNAAIVLANFGLKVMINGPFLGYNTKDGILNFLKKYNIDCSELYFDKDFEGVQDLVLVDENSRTVFGRFNQYLFGGEKKWAEPTEQAIRSAEIISVDPFFCEESKLAADLCVKNGKKYVTIDCVPENKIHKNAAATVISNEFIKREFPNEMLEILFKKYISLSEGLVIFTFGKNEILYGRKHGKINKFTPYRVKAINTLGAGDTFRAGVVYGILKEWDDEKIIKFAAATAALVCTRFPMALNPPSLGEILGLIENK